MMEGQMMDQQVVPMNEQPDDLSEQPNVQRDRQNIVSPDPRRGAMPGVKQAPQETPPRNPPVGMPGASGNQQDQVAARAQQLQPDGSAANVATPPQGSRLSPDGPSVVAGEASPGPDAMPPHPARKQGPSVAQPMPLLSAEMASGFRARWDTMQAAFVDEPRQVVEQADSLVAEVMQRIAETMAQERTGLERQWAEGKSANTEDLRLALQRYRSFFQRLLSA